MREGPSLKLSNVLIISYHFYPSNEIGARRLTAVARYLADRGVRVTIVSAFGSRPVESGAELLPGVFAIPVPRPGRVLLNALVALKQRRRAKSGATQAQDNRLNSEPSQPRADSFKTRAREVFFRIVYFVDEYKRWAWRAARATIETAKQCKIDVILASGPPHSALAAAAYAARVLKVPFVADLRDPWSDYLDWQSSDRSLELNILRSLERRVLRGAAAVTSTGETVAALLVKRDVSLAGRVWVIRNGFDGAPCPGERSTGGRLVILFAGELYVGRNPFPFLSALEYLLNRNDVDASRIEVTFMGKVEMYGGQSLDQWLQGKRARQVVRIVPTQPAAAVATAAAAATVLLNLAQGQHLSVPAKTFEHLASGREVLLVCENDCETACLVAGIKGINQVDPADSAAFARVLLDLYQRHVNHGELLAPVPTDFSRFSREYANGSFLKVLESVM